MKKKLLRTSILTCLLIITMSSLVLAASWTRYTTYGKVMASHSSTSDRYGYISRIQTSAQYQRGNGTITVKTTTTSTTPSLIQQGKYAYGNSINNYGVSTALHYGGLVDHFHDYWETPGNAMPTSIEKTE